MSYPAPVSAPVSAVKVCFLAQCLGCFTSLSDFQMVLWMKGHNFSCVIVEDGSAWGWDKEMCLLFASETGQQRCESVSIFQTNPKKRLDTHFLPLFPTWFLLPTKLDHALQCLQQFHNMYLILCNGYIIEKWKLEDGNWNVSLRGDVSAVWF